MSHALINNAPLLQLPPVSSFDVIAARGLVEVMTDVVVAIALLAGFLAIGLRAMPDDLWEPSITVLTIAAFGCGIGFVNAVVTVFWRSWEKTYAQLTRLLYFVSGIFYVPGMMPDWVRDILAWNPLLHAIDWFRAGFFEVYRPHWLDRSYVAIVAIATLLAGGAAPPAEPQVERRAVIALDGVEKSYRSATGRKVLLDHVSAEFCPGYNFGILGANGAGKSTLIRLLAGSETPDRGTIRRRVRVSFPLGFGGTVHGALSGRENVAFIARVYGAGVRQTARFVEEFAELGEYFDMPVDTCWGCQRVQLFVMWVWVAARPGPWTTLPCRPRWSRSRRKGGLRERPSRRNSGCSWCRNWPPECGPAPPGPGRPASCR